MLKCRMSALFTSFNIGLMVKRRMMSALFTLFNLGLMVKCRMMSALFTLFNIGLMVWPIVVTVQCYWKKY